MIEAILGSVLGLLCGAVAAIKFGPRVYPYHPRKDFLGREDNERSTATTTTRPHNDVGHSCMVQRIPGASVKDHSTSREGGF